MEPTIYKPGAYKTPGVYKTPGIYNGCGVYNDGYEGVSSVEIDGIIYHYKKIAGKKWLLEDLRNIDNLGITLETDVYPYQSIPKAWTRNGCVLYNSYCQDILNNLKTGWRLPTYNDFHALFLEFNNFSDKLKAENFNGNNETGFNFFGYGDISGDIATPLVYLNYGIFGTLLGEIENNDGHAIRIFKDNSTIQERTVNVEFGYQVRLCSD